MACRPGATNVKKDLIYLGITSTKALIITASNTYNFQSKGVSFNAITKSVRLHDSLIIAILEGMEGLDHFQVGRG